MLGPRIYTGRREAYECLACLFEWRQNLPREGQGVSCPRCGHLYVEWLSYDIDPRDVYFRNTEPTGSITKRVL